MIIKRMRAHFGKLNGELELCGGMNILVLPNEGGKSTWSAFLLAMLYGIDTSERAKKENGNLPAKERFRPWDGGAPEGSIELIHSGRTITIERRSSKTVPLGLFRAYDTETGAPITELTAENCGLMLCGVERPVFERSAFIRQLGLSVSADTTLEKRLGALVTTGEEGAKSASELERLLRERKNYYSYRSSGKIARLQAELSEKERTLAQIEEQQNEWMALRAEVQTCEAQVQRLSALEVRVARAQEARRRESLVSAERAVREQRALCASLREKCAALAPEDALKSAAQRLDSAEAALQTAQLEAALGAGEAPVRKPSPVFGTHSAEEARARVQADLALFHNGAQVKAPTLKPAFALCALLLVISGALFAFSNAVWGTAALGCAAIFAAIVFPLLNKKRAAFHAVQAQNQKILSSYGAKDEQEILDCLQAYLREWEDFERTLSARQTQQAALANALADAQQALSAALSPLHAETAQQARSAISEALKAHAALADEERRLASEERNLATLREITDPNAPQQTDPEALRHDPAEVRRAREQAQDALATASARLSFRQGQRNALGDAVSLRAQIETLGAQLSEAQNALAATELARAALAEADGEMRRRFSPQIAGEAGAILTELTQGKYGTLLLSPDMNLSVREPDGVVMRPAAAMSCGTTDQMYLALRLAMCRKLLGADVPLVLDDALVNFDEARTAAALRVLRKEAETRQILLFSCRKLED